MVASSPIVVLEDALRLLCGHGRRTMAGPDVPSAAAPDPEKWRAIAGRQRLLERALDHAATSHDGDVSAAVGPGLGRCWHLLARPAAPAQIARYYLVAWRDVDVDDRRVWANARLLVAATAAALALRPADGRDHADEVAPIAGRWLDLATQAASGRVSGAVVPALGTPEAYADEAARRAQVATVAARLAVGRCLGGDPSGVLHRVRVPVLSRTTQGTVSASLQLALLDGGPRGLIEDPVSLRPLSRAWIDALGAAWRAADLPGCVGWSVRVESTGVRPDEPLLGDLHGAACAVGFRLLAERAHHDPTAIVVAGVRDDAKLESIGTWTLPRGGWPSRVRRVALAPGGAIPSASVRSGPEVVAHRADVGGAASFAFTARAGDWLAPLWEVGFDPADPPGALVWVDDPFGGPLNLVGAAPSGVHEMVLVRPTSNLDPFYVDRHPVTVGRYAAYAPRGNQHLGQSMFALSADEMWGYARWAGKALPTLEQWYAAFAPSDLGLPKLVAGSGQDDPGEQAEEVVRTWEQRDQHHGCWRYSACTPPIDDRSRSALASAGRPAKGCQKRPVDVASEALSNCTFRCVADFALVAHAVRGRRPVYVARIDPGSAEAEHGVLQRSSGRRRWIHRRRPPHVPRVQLPVERPGGRSR